MAGSITFIQTTGSSATETEKSSFVFLSDDSATLSKTDAPVRIPTTGSAYSYEVWLRAICKTAPATSIFNVKLWVQSTPKPAGFDVTINSSQVSSYVQPTKNESTAGTRISFYDRQSSAAGIVLSGELTSVGAKTNFAVLQLKVDSTALPTALSLPISFSYDEI